MHSSHPDNQPVNDAQRGDGRSTGLIGLVIVVVIVAVVIGAIVHSSHGSNAKKDVTLTSCKAGANGGKPTATGRVANSTSKNSTYAIRVKFEDSSGNSVSNGVATVNRVDAHTTGTWQLTGATAAKGKVACEITGVTRTHIPGT